MKLNDQAHVGSHGADVVKKSALGTAHHVISLAPRRRDRCASAQSFPFQRTRNSFSSLPVFADDKPWNPLLLQVA